MAEKEHDSLLLEMVKQLREDLAADRQERRQDAEASRESRAATHKRIDDVVERLGKIDTSMAIAGQIDAQVRSELDSLKATVESLKPTAQEWSIAKRIGITAAGLIGVSAAGLGTWIAWAGDQAWTAIRHALRLP